MKGSPREMGRQIGEACRDLVSPLVDHILFRMNEHRVAPVAESRALEEAGRYVAVAERYAPDVVDELRGVAEGANVSLEAVMLVNARSEVAFATRGQEGCTAVAVSREASATGGVILGQNWDNDPEMARFSLVITREAERGPAFACWTQPGIAAYIGMNESGLGLCMNALAGPSRREGLPWYFTVRRVIESATVEEARSAIEGSARARCGNLAMVAEGEALDFEVQIDASRVVRSGADGVLVHTNHCVHPDLAPRNREFADDLYGQTFERASRARQMIESGDRPINVDRVKAILSDHHDAPTSICRHPNDHPATGWQRSVISIVMEPDRGAMHISRGNPCEHPYETYQLN